MLQLRNISKQYKTGDLIQNALENVSLDLRDNEFVSILGPSGSGKTTLLNIIGGLDRYDDGDLLINGVSTRKYNDRDWDSYRNHAIGFVFQSYNLIPHQTVLSNVELALTIGGISKSERKKRAKKALEEVGLGGQFHKRPNQMSGGQMQRVAIARALVNDPDILLADEPTGALDSETSIQIMELLKKVADKRLVVMVTHNPELAKQYSTRIVKLKDGKIIDDSNPFESTEKQEITEKKPSRARMGFFTSLALSFQNLRTKKGRTFLTAFAGSIGIIGIALILALSTGMNRYIADIQKETMISYPITINARAFDLMSVMGMRRQMLEARRSANEQAQEKKEGIYEDNSRMQVSNAFSSGITENDLTAFKKYLDDPDSEIQQYLGESGVVYTYAVNFQVYAHDGEGTIVNTNADPDEAGSSSRSRFGGMMSGSMGLGLSSSSGNDSAENFSEIMAGSDGEIVSPIVRDNYDLVYGGWPENANEVVLVLDQNNAVSTKELFQLGFITAEEYRQTAETISNGEEPEERVLDYAEALQKSFVLAAACDHYRENEDGTFTYIGDDAMELEKMLENGIELKISGIIRPKEGASNAAISTCVAYTSLLTDFLIQHTDESAVVKKQEEDPGVNVLTGMSFEAADEAEKLEDAKEYIRNMGVSEQASLYSMIMYYQSSSGEDSGSVSSAVYPGQAGEFSGMDPGAAADESMMASALLKWLDYTPDTEILLTIYDQYVSGSTYEENMQNFGKVSLDAPDSISIYTDSFEDKEAVADCISRYNEGVDEDSGITYTDYVELMTSSLTTIINAISYVLIAFVAVSLVVSCIMIGIITHISVLERTKEIGILRALGASKRNISQVFNAETVIIGFFSGLLGVVVSVLLTIPINRIIQSLVNVEGLSAKLPLKDGVLLILLSMVITVIGGLLPAKKAAKKDPVVALRTE